MLLSRAFVSGGCCEAPNSHETYVSGSLSLASRPRLEGLDVAPCWERRRALPRRGT